MPDGAHPLSAVSVVVPHYGHPSMALALIARLGAQRTARDVQIIVVDDLSPQPFPEIPGLEVVRHARNRGFGTAVNSGAAVARHDLLLVLNSDLEPDEDFLESLIRAAEPFQPAVCSPALLEEGVWGPTAYRFPSAASLTLQSLMPLSRFAGSRWLRRWEISDSRCRPGVDRETDWVAGACLLLPTGAFHQVGGFDESFYMYGEDTDLGLRLHRAGLRSMLLGSVTVTHGLSGSSDPGRIAAWNAEARFRYAEKWGFRRRLALGLLTSIVVNLGYNLLRRALGKDVSPLGRARYEWGLLRHGLAGVDARPPMV